MLIPPQKIQNELRSDSTPGAKVQLKSSHLLVDREVSKLIFENESNVNVVYYPDRKSLMVAPASDDLFKKLHKAKQFMLKDRNIRGDKSIVLHELLIDNDVNDSDRNLEYEVQKELKILNVKL